VIVVDSSALVAILEEEPEHREFKSIIEAAPRRVVSSVTVYETGIVLLRRRGPDGLDDVSALIDAFDFEIVAFDRSFSDAALKAYARFGKGIDPKAQLNMGDCVSYALVKSLDAPLLFKGNDFTTTDIKRCR
jgi:ribonuclease VapC